MIFILQSRYLR